MKEFLDFQPSIDTDLSTAGQAASETHSQRTLGLKEQQAEALGLPPVPEKGVDVFGSLRLWLAKDNGHFTGERHHGQPGDPGYFEPTETA